MQSSYTTEGRGSVLLKEDQPSHQTAKEAERKTERKPKRGVGKADLPEKLAGQAAVIPDAKPQPKVEQAPCRKLHGGDEKGGLQRAHPEARVRIGLVEAVDKEKADRAANGHAPV